MWNEPDAADYTRALLEAIEPKISAGTLLEACIVVDGAKDAIVSRRFDQFLQDIEAVIEPITAEHVEIARAAYRDYGRKSGHPANLNFGDCFAYALARATGEPLLYKGNDFSHTDLKSAL